MNEGMAGACKAYAKDDGWEMQAGPPDPEHGRRSGGVGIVAKCPMKTIPIAGASKDYQDAYEAGRAAIYACDLGAATLHISVIYGWTGGIKGSIACDRTDDLLSIVAQENQSLPAGPKIIMGDLNCELQDLESVTTLISEEGWMDLGANANIWGGKANEPTCHTNAMARETRRDYAYSQRSPHPMHRRRASA